MYLYHPSDSFCIIFFLKKRWLYVFDGYTTDLIISEINSLQKYQNVILIWQGINFLATKSLIWGVKSLNLNYNIAYHIMTDYQCTHSERQNVFQIIITLLYVGRNESYRTVKSLTVTSTFFFCVEVHMIYTKNKNWIELH